MTDRKPTIRDPHDATVTREGGKKKVVKHDPRVSVEIREEAATLTLFFDSDRAWTGDAPLREVRLTPAASGEFYPWRLVPQLPFHLAYAQACLARDKGRVIDAIKALRGRNSTRRGLDDDFLREIAAYYGQLVKAHEPYPIKAMSEALPIDKSTASRWVSAARRRGLLQEQEGKR